MEYNNIRYKKIDIFFVSALLLFNFTIFFSDLLPYNTILKFISVILLLIDLIVFRDAKLKINPRYTPYFFFMIYLWMNIFIGGDKNFVLTFTINTFALFLLSSFYEFPKVEISIIGLMCGVHLIASLVVEIVPVGIVNNLFSRLMGAGYNVNYSWRIISGVNVGITNQPGVNAMYLVSFFVFCFAKIYTKSKGKIFYFLGMMLSLIFIFTTEKRAASIFAPLCIMIFLFIFHQKKIKRNKLIAIAIMIIGIVFIFRYLNMKTSILTNLTEKTMDLFADHDVSNGRLTLWNDAISQFSQYPILGIGVKSFYNVTGLDVHNTYIQILTETGIVGALLFIFALGVMLKNMFSVSKKIFLEQKGIMDISMCYGLTIIIFLLVYGCVGNTFIDYLPLSIFIVAVGLVDVCTGYYRESKISN